jgi:hypothetical protein
MQGMDSVLIALIVLVLIELLVLKERWAVGRIRV